VLHSLSQSGQAIYSLCNIGTHCLYTLLNRSVVIAAAAKVLAVNKKEEVKNLGPMWGQYAFDMVSGFRMRRIIKSAACECDKYSNQWPDCF